MGKLCIVTAPAISAVGFWLMRSKNLGFGYVTALGLERRPAGASDFRPFAITKD